MTRTMDEPEYTVWTLQRNVNELLKLRDALNDHDRRDIALIIKELQKLEVNHVVET